MEHESDKLSGFLAGILVGGAIGSLLTMLFTPVSGKRMRRNIANRTEDIIEEANEYYEISRDKVSSTIKEGRTKIDKFIDDGRKKVDSFLEETKGKLSS
jgi:gas vesicle protein